MQFLIDMYAPDTYVEIGVQKAWTFNQISPLVKTAIAVDVAPMPKVAKRDNVEVREQSSSDFALYWMARANTDIDLLLIDGDHSSIQVEKDFNSLGRYVTPGTGIVLLHDTYPSNAKLMNKGYCHDAWKVADWIHSGAKYRDAKQWEIFTFPGPYAGMSILRKRTEHHLHWFKPAIVVPETVDPEAHVDYKEEGNDRWDDNGGSTHSR